MNFVWKNKNETWTSLCCNIITEWLDVHIRYEWNMATYNSCKINQK